MGAFGGDFDAPLENLVEVVVGIPYLKTPATASAGLVQPTRRFRVARSARRLRRRG